MLVRVRKLHANANNAINIANNMMLTLTML